MENNPEASSVQFNEIDEKSLKSIKELSGHIAPKIPIKVKQLDTNLYEISEKSNRKSCAKVCRCYFAGDCQEDKLETVKTSIERRFESQPKDKDNLSKDVSQVYPPEKVIAEKENRIHDDLTNSFASNESDYKEIAYDGWIERTYPSGKTAIRFQSGTIKIISADGQAAKLFFDNGDTKDVYPDKKEIYKYVNGVVLTNFPDGLQLIEFPSGQVERIYADGYKEVNFPDGTIHYFYTDGSQEIHSPDGSLTNLSVDGTETVEFPNGEEEIITATHKRKKFLDGSVKIMYASGRKETRYTNGRIRVKDKHGNLVVDTKYLGVSKEASCPYIKNQIQVPVESVQERQSKTGKKTPMRLLLLQQLVEAEMQMLRIKSS